jgi:hypothetical protein
MMIFKFTTLLGLVCSLWCSAVCAEQLRYMDEAGNIRFVNRMSEVPRQHREQIVPPTPTPVLDRRQKAEIQRRQQQEQRRREQEERQRKFEEQRRIAQAEQNQRRLERERLKMSGQDRIYRGSR